MKNNCVPWAAGANLKNRIQEDHSPLPFRRRQEQRQGLPTALAHWHHRACADHLHSASGPTHRPTPSLPHLPPRKGPGSFSASSPPTGPPHHYPTYPHGRGQAAPLQRHLFFVLTPSCCSASPDTALAGIVDFFSIFLIFIYCVWLHLVSVASTRFSIFSVACAI